MVYSITQNNKTEIVFGKAFTVPSYPTPVIKDLFGADVAMADAIAEGDKNRNRDTTVVGTCCQITRNMELGKLILAKFREWVCVKNEELGLSGNGVELLNSFYLIECALLAGMLSEASELIAQITETAVITAECKVKFEAACLSADHMT